MHGQVVVSPSLLRENDKVDARLPTIVSCLTKDTADDRADRKDLSHPQLLDLADIDRMCVCVCVCACVSSPISSINNTNGGGGWFVTRYMYAGVRGCVLGGSAEKYVVSKPFHTYSSAQCANISKRRGNNTATLVSYRFCLDTRKVEIGWWWSTST